MAPISAMTTTTVHRIGILFRKLRPKLSRPAVCSGLGLLVAYGER